MYEKLKKTMDERGITAYRLAKNTGIGSNHIYRALGGHITLFPGWKARIAEELNMTVPELFPEETEIEKERLEDRIEKLRAELKRLEEEAAR